VAQDNLERHDILVLQDILVAQVHHCKRNIEDLEWVVQMGNILVEGIVIVRTAIVHIVIGRTVVQRDTVALKGTEFALDYSKVSVGMD
jgi:hypothetical protein